MTRPASARAIVVGLDTNGLGVIRSLARAGVSTLGLDTDIDKPSAGTRFGEKRTIPAIEGDRLVDTLLDIARAERAPPTLFLTQEQSVRTVAHAQDRLRPALRFAMPSADIVERLMNKDGFMPIVAASGLDAPETVTVRGPCAEADFARLQPPFIVKPSERTPAYSARFRKAYVVETVTEVMHLCREIAEVHPEVIVQEWIPGGDEDIFFTLQYIGSDGRLVAAFTGRKLASWPPRVGGTAMCMPAPGAHENLNALTFRFFRTAGFVGMGSMEYKRDPRTGRFHVIEPTVSRTDYQSEVATLNGVNLPALAYRAETGGETPEPAWPDGGRVLAWRDPYAAQGRIELATSGCDGDGRGWTAVDSLFRWNDPGPWLRYRVLPVSRRLHKYRGEAG